MDDGCDELWVDFNLVPKVIRVYCQKHPSVDMDIKWDSMAIETSDIGRYDVNRIQGKKCPIYLLFFIIKSRVFMCSQFWLTHTLCAQMPFFVHTPATHMYIL